MSCCEADVMLFQLVSSYLLHMQHNQVQQEVEYWSMCIVMLEERTHYFKSIVGRKTVVVAVWYCGMVLYQ